MDNITDRSGQHNDLEIRMLGIRRSGNHALMNWIESQSVGNLVCLNNVLALRPFDSCAYSGIITGDCESDRSILLHTYEHEIVSRVFCNSAFEKDHDKLVGQSKRCINILLLRDPFNLFASNLRRSIGVDNNEFNIHIWEKLLWLDHAEEFLGITNHIPHEKLCVNFNRWARDYEYRKELAITLGLTFTDAGINDVVSINGGSSFDKTDFDGRAQEMEILSRWKHFPNVLRKLIKDGRFVEYSREIFGSIFVDEVAEGIAR